jgi:hypothetical protein
MRRLCAANQGAIAMELNVVTPRSTLIQRCCKCKQHQENSTESKVGAISQNQGIIGANITSLHHLDCYCTECRHQLEGNIIE